MSQIAFVTYKGLPDLAQDEQLVRAALAVQGVTVVPAVWDDSLVSWDRFEAVILRTCWDYHLHPDRFDEWIAHLERLGVPLWNPPGLLRWNSNKRYLADLRDRGVSIVPTEFCRAGSSVRLAEVLKERGWREAVVKPAVSANSFQTWQTTDAQADSDQTLFDSMLESGDVLVQPFLPEIRSDGEWSFMFIGGQYSHAMIKRPLPGDFRVQSTFGGTATLAEPPTSLRTQAEQVAASIHHPWLYARVDGVESDGEFLLMELELIEPLLFLTQQPQAVTRFVEAILERLSQGKIVTNNLG